MTLWIDGDSCPQAAMRIALDAHRNRAVEVVVVADRRIPKVAESGARMIRVASGCGAVDEIMVRECRPGDLALTRDLSLGLRLLDRDVVVLNDRGHVWTANEIKLRREEAVLMQMMRKGIIAPVLPRTYSGDDAREFSLSLSRLTSYKP